MTGDEFRERLERQYMRHTGDESSHGAQVWWRRLCHGPGRMTLYRWTRAGEVEESAHTTLLRVLEALPPGTPWAADLDALTRELDDDFPHAGTLRSAGYRTESAVFHAHDLDLMELPGIGPAGVREMRDRIRRGREAREQVA